MVKGRQLGGYRTEEKEDLGFRKDPFAKKEHKEQRLAIAAHILWS